MTDKQNFKRDSIAPLEENNGLIDLHISILPSHNWNSSINCAPYQTLSDAVTIGFIRCSAQSSILHLREEIEIQLADDKMLPGSYIFLKGVGRALVAIRPRQEQILTVENFKHVGSRLPPEICIMEVDDSFDENFLKGYLSRSDSKNTSKGFIHQSKPGKKSSDEQVISDRKRMSNKTGKSPDLKPLKKPGQRVSVKSQNNNKNQPQNQDILAQDLRNRVNEKVLAKQDLKNRRKSSLKHLNQLSSSIDTTSSSDNNIQNHVKNIKNKKIAAAQSNPNRRGSNVRFPPGNDINNIREFDTNENTVVLPRHYPISERDQQKDAMKKNSIEHEKNDFDQQNDKSDDISARISKLREGQMRQRFFNRSEARAVSFGNNWYAYNSKFGPAYISRPGWFTNFNNKNSKNKLN